MSTPRIIIGRVGYCPKGYIPYRCDRNTNSPLKNPFGGKNNPNNGREEACNQFSAYFSKEMINRTSALRIAVRRLLRRLQKGESICLQCHCLPLRCHTETIKQYLDKELANG